jgi:hypothetical protein
MAVVMTKQQTIFRWLAAAALGEWFILRTVTRAAIHAPTSPAAAAFFQGLNTVGLVAASLAALLALLALGWIAWQEWRHQGAVVLPALLIMRAGFSVLFLILVPVGWTAVFAHLLTLTIIILIVAPAIIHQPLSAVPRPSSFILHPLSFALIFPALALLAGLLFQALPALYAAAGWPGPAPFTSLLFNLGELFVVASVGALWWVYGRSRTVWHWLVAAVPALLFALSFWRDPAMTGILTIWSTGLTLFLPWPFYVAALWLAGVTVLAAWESHPAVAYAVLLLTAAGYAPQLSSQLFCALAALWLLAQTMQPAVAMNRVTVFDDGRLQTILPDRYVPATPPVLLQDNPNEIRPFIEDSGT